MDEIHQDLLRRIIAAQLAVLEHSDDHALPQRISKEALIYHLETALAKAKQLKG